MAALPLLSSKGTEPSCRGAAPLPPRTQAPLPRAALPCFLKALGGRRLGDSLVGVRGSQCRAKTSLRPHRSWGAPPDSSWGLTGCSSSSLQPPREALGRSCPSRTQRLHSALDRALGAAGVWGESGSGMTTELPSLHSHVPMGPSCTAARDPRTDTWMGEGRDCPTRPLLLTQRSGHDSAISVNPCRLEHAHHPTPQAPAGNPTF